jgi:hypothetical protein
LNSPPLSKSTECTLNGNLFLTASNPLINVNGENQIN